MLHRSVNAVADIVVSKLSVYKQVLHYDKVTGTSS